ncbi:MAG: phage holin family protein, partial [Chloroflexi bacterium]|nr:phage holin family protein [Chloroflexota bacterium]
MRKLLLRWLINAVAVWAAVEWIQGISAEGGWGTVLVVALILGLVNALIAPILKLLTCPLILLTLGLFTLVINALMLMLAEAIARALGIAFYVEGFVSALLGSLVISVVSFALSV